MSSNLLLYLGKLSALTRAEIAGTFEVPIEAVPLLRVKTVLKMYGSLIDRKNPCACFLCKDMKQLKFSYDASINKRKRKTQLDTKARREGG